MNRPLRAVSRLAHGTGLAQLRHVRHRVDRLIADLDEHVELQDRLAEEVARLEGRVADTAAAVRRRERR